MKDFFYECSKDKGGRVFVQTQVSPKSRMHFHKAIELSYVFEGEANYCIEGVPLVVGTDRLVFSYAYYAHSSAAHKPFSQYTIAVPANFSADIVSLFKGNILPILMDDVEFNRTLKPYFECMMKTDKSTPDIVIKGYINLIFGLLVDHYRDRMVAPKHKNVQLITEILDYVEEHYEENISLAEIAEHFNYNKSYFSRFFNKHVGLSLNDYINGMRLDRYEELVKLYPDKGVAELIFQAGFQSLATFYRVRDFRERAKKEKA